MQCAVMQCAVASPASAPTAEVESGMHSWLRDEKRFALAASTAPPVTQQPNFDVAARFVPDNSKRKRSVLSFTKAYDVSNSEQDIGPRTLSTIQHCELSVWPVAVLAHARHTSQRSQSASLLRHTLR